MDTVQDDLDDLVGTPRRSQRDQKLDDLLAKNRQARGTGGPMVEDMLAGVTVSWLSQVFGMDPKTVKAKLADCPPLHRRKAGYVYSLPVACQYLVRPAISPEQYIKTMKPSDLPSHFQQTFWDAALKRQKWEENAGQLWRTEKVIEVLGHTFQTIKFTLQLFPDTLERQTGLSDEQRTILTTLLDQLQQDIYVALVQQAKDTQTGSQKSELPGMVDNEDGEYDDAMDLV